MLRGNHPATVDAKYRIKVPTAFRNKIRAEHGDDLFVTSFSGENLLIYPLGEWVAVEKKLANVATMTPARRKYINRVNYYGIDTAMDRQGRFLVPALLRESAGIDGEVVVMGQLTHLEVWNHETFRARMDANPLTEDDQQALADLGI